LALALCPGQLGRHGHLAGRLVPDPGVDAVHRKSPLDVECCGIRRKSAARTHEASITESVGRGRRGRSASRGKALADFLVRCGSASLNAPRMLATETDTHRN